MRWHTVNYLERDGGRRDGQLLNRGFWLNGVPRIMPLCRLLGHRAVVDGTNPVQVRPDYRGPGNRWVCCDRCGIRPNPQGSLDPEQWSIGQPYTGPHRYDWPTDGDERFAAIKAGGAPGPWPAKPTSEIGGQLVIGDVHATSIQVKLGNRGSEQVLAGHITIHRIAALYVHTERHGTWLQRRFNPTGYESREIGFSIHGGRLFWSLWAPRNRWSSADPKWWQGSFRIDPRDILLGDRRYSYNDVEQAEDVVLRMPHGDDHRVSLKLQRCTLTRARRRRPIKITWTVDVRVTPGIPTKPGGHGGVTGFGVQIPEHEGGDWVALGLAAAADRMTRDRARYGYRSTSEVTS
jgi:hypothetical protein